MMSPRLMSAVDAIFIFFRGRKDKGGTPQSKRKLHPSKLPVSKGFKVYSWFCFL
jgi:hypothetical protein